MQTVRLGLIGFGNVGQGLAPPEAPRIQGDQGPIQRRRLLPFSVEGQQVRQEVQDVDLVVAHGP